MATQSPPPRAGWRFEAPFVLGDLVLLVTAWLLVHQANRPMVGYEVGAITLCVLAGAILGILPFIMRFRAETQLAEIAELRSTLEQIQNLEEISERIDRATGHWQTVQEHSVKTVDAARAIAERIGAERKEFSVFVDKAAEGERNHLRLEVDKLRRSETEWVQVLVRIMDNVYALYLAGAHSGQAGLMEQLGNFQSACREAARRTGLVPLLAPPGSPYDPKFHQLAEGSPEAAAGSCVRETVVTGYSYQAQVIRLPIVQVQAAKPAEIVAPAPKSGSPTGPGDNNPMPTAATGDDGAGAPVTTHEAEAQGEPDEVSTPPKGAVKIADEDRPHPTGVQ